tara:strand:+ start:1635 stop:2402 length:768 start_codon:yes stop_codon:yes gene_type:complete
LELFLQQILLGLAAIIANFFSAFSGGGAGLIQLPVLILFGLPFPVALATHKLASVALGIGAGIRHLKQRTLTPYLSSLILVSGLPGVFIGSQIVIFIPESIATTILGSFTLCLGLYSFKNSDLGINDSQYRFQLGRHIVGAIVLFLIGIVNGSLSSGTGLFVTIWLVRWFGLTYSKAIGFTLILVGFFWNGTGAFIVGIQSDVKWDWIISLVIGSLIGGYLGAHASLSTANHIVKRAFETISIAMGLALIYRGIL